MIDLSIIGDSFHVELDYDQIQKDPYRALDLVYSLIELDKGSMIDCVMTLGGLTKEDVISHYEVRCATQA